MAHRKKVGDLYAIQLPDNTYAYGRVLQEVSVAFYRHRGEKIEDLPDKEDYEFIVGVHQSCFKEWIFVENRPFADSGDSLPPCYQMRDIFTGKYSIYNFGKITPATKEECENLEVCAVWEYKHIIDRLMGRDWKKWFPRFYQ